MILKPLKQSTKNKERKIVINNKYNIIGKEVLYTLYLSSLRKL